MGDKLNYPLKHMPKTKIVCTLGPSTENVDILKELVLSGMSVARINMSHGTLDTHAKVLKRVRSISDSLGIPVGVMVDIPGTKYRTGPMDVGAVKLQDGDEITLTSEDIIGNSSRVSVSPPGIHADAEPGGTILVDDGNIELRVIKIIEMNVICTVVRGSRITERRGVVTPGKSPSQVFPDAKAIECLHFAAEHKADFVALSTVTKSEDISKARDVLKVAGMATPYIISKVERAEAIENIQEIVDESDALMVARGDMGVEVPLKRVPIIQKDLIKRSNSAGKPVITATQMLESMISSSSPTRAEVTDVANAVFDGTDAIMLSGETSIGKFPIAAVKVMAETAAEAEKALPYESMMRERHRQLKSETDDAISFAACQTANELNSKLIVAFTESGSSAGRVSRYRPKAKIIALTPWPEVEKRLTLRWAVFPLIVKNVRNVEDFFSIGESQTKKIIGESAEGTVVLVGGTPIGVPGSTNLLRVLNLTQADS